MSKQHRKNDTSKVAAPGEPVVWFTAMGLTAGLLLIIMLLWVIISNAVPVFWPRKVVEVTYTENGTSQIFAGELRLEREKAVSDDSGRFQKEQQFYVGNRDVNGYSFKFIDSESVQEVKEPEDILVMERMEYGKVIAFPVSLLLADGSTVTPKDDGFLTNLETLVEEAGDRREKIKEIEKDEIGRINHELEKVRLKGGDAGKEASLQAEFEELDKEAKKLRADQERDVLTVRTASGKDNTVVVGHVLGFYEPNKLGFFSRLGHFFANIWNFLTEDPREANTEGGVFPAIFGTLVMTILMSAFVTPLGVVAAIYLREYAKQGILVRSVRIAVNNLAGVPSIVFGVFGLGFFVYLVGGGIDQVFFSDKLPTPTYGTGGLFWASLTLALMTIPVVIVATEEALAAVPRGMREASLACGASKWQTIQRIVLPASVPGIITGLILAMARGAGEVAPLMLVGVVKLAPDLPIDGIAPFFHPDRKFMHLGFHIYDLGFQSPDSEAAKPMVFATTLLLISLVVVLNLAAIIIRNRLRRKFSTSAF